MQHGFEQLNRRGEAVGALQALQEGAQGSQSGGHKVACKQMMSCMHAAIVSAASGP